VEDGPKFYSVWVLNTFVLGSREGETGWWGRKNTKPHNPNSSKKTRLASASLNFLGKALWSQTRKAAKGGGKAINGLASDPQAGKQSSDLVPLWGGRGKKMLNCFSKVNVVRLAFKLYKWSYSPVPCGTPKLRESARESKRKQKDWSQTRGWKTKS